jgi:hypothetical protein
VFQPACLTTAGGWSAGVALLVPVGLTLTKAPSMCRVSDRVVWATVQRGGSKALLASVYGHVNSASLALRLLEDVVRQALVTGHPFFVGGDFNVTPEQASQALLAHPSFRAARVCRARRRTCGGVSEIDWFLASEACLPLLDGVSVRETALASRCPVVCRSRFTSGKVNLKAPAPKPKGGHVFGPKWQADTRSIDHVLANSPVCRDGTADECLWGQGYHVMESQEQVDVVWRLWLEAAREELARNTADEAFAHAAQPFTTE